MADLNINNFQQDHSSVTFVVTCIIITIGLPLTLVAIYAVYLLVRNDHVAPIYVINLLISDLIQLCCMIVEVAPLTSPKTIKMFFYIYYFGVIASVFFMVCISFERYLIVTCPLWYHSRRTIKVSVAVCVVVWLLPLIYLLTFHLFDYTEVVSAVFFLLPLPLFIFFLVGTLRALSTSCVPSHEKRRVVGIVVMVLLIYTVLFLPSVIWYATYHQTFTTLSLTLLRVSPLADLFLYVFMRKGIIDKLLASVCCCRMDSSPEEVEDKTEEEM